MQVFAHSKSLFFLQRLGIALLFALVLPVAAWAQPTLAIGSTSGNNGENVCVPVTVQDFTLVNTLQASIQYDNSVVEFTSLTEVSLTGISFTDFPVDGVVNVEWQNTPDGCDGNVGLDLPDSDIAFELCFDVVGAYGEQSPLMIVSSNDDPYIQYRMTRVTTSCLNILPFRESGLITVGVRPLIIDIGEEGGNPGDLVCVDVVVESGWDALSSIQFSMGWDENIMLLENIIAGDQIPNFSVAGNTGNPTADCMTVSWFAVPGNPPPSVDDGTLFFQLCFRIIGDCEETTEVDVKPGPTGTEVTNEVAAGQNLPFQSRAGEVSVSDCDLVGIEIAADCGEPVNINDQICVAVVAGTNFVDINNLDFLMEWNSSILEYTGVQGFNLPTLNAGSFDATNAANGVLGVEWDVQIPAAQTRAPGETLFEVCFNVIGLGGNSPFTIVPGTGEMDGDQNNIVPTNCEVQVIQPAGVSMRLGDIDAALGGTTCLPITVSGFVDVLSYQFSLNWDPAIWDYVNIQTNTLGMTVGDAGAASGSLFFDWDSGGTAVTLDDNSLLLEICFTPDPLAVPGDCDLLQVVPIPLVAEAITTESNGDNVGVTAIDGEMCVLFPEGFGLTVIDTEGLWMDTICVPVTVSSFDNITDASFCVNFSPSNLDLVDVNYIGNWPGLDFDLTSADVGLICADWTNPTPLAIPDDEVVFELCFDAIGVADTCYNINITPEGEPPVTTSDGQGSLVVTNGQLCVEDRLILTDVTITPESCPGAADGMIELSVIGGREPYGTSWANVPNQFVPLLATDLSAGEVYFTVFDDSNPALLLTDTVVVPLLGEGPVVEIAMDSDTLGCNPPQILISGNADDGLSLRWYIVGGDPNVGDEATIFAASPGTYVLEGTDTETGCTDSDTIIVFTPELPVAVIDTFTTTSTTAFTCEIDTLLLDASINSTQGVGINYTWTVVSGVEAGIAAGTETEAQAGILGPGVYRLVVTNAVTNCSSVPAEITVTDGRIPVDASATPLDGSAEQNCDGSPTMFTAINSNNPGLDVRYDWYDLDGNLIGGDTQEVGLVNLGQYYLEVTDLTSGCTGRDTVMLIANESAPEVMNLTDPDQNSITCLQETVQLAAEITGGNNPTFTWVASNGGMIEPGTETTLTPTATSGGVYTLNVIDDSGCEAQLVIEVGEETTPPTVEAGDAQELGCMDTETTLSGTGSDEGPEFTYQWYLGDTDTPIGGATMLTYTATQPGIYFLEVTNNATGCTDTDEVEVTSSDETPAITIDNLAVQLDCTTLTDTLTATISPIGPNYLINWEALNGSPFIQIDDLTIVVSATDTYTLTVTNTDANCQSTVDVMVSNNAELPELVVTASAESVDCNDGVDFDASGTPDADNTTFVWTGGTLTDPVMNPTLSVNDPGTYTLTITNNLTGCENDSTFVIANATQPPTVDTLPAASLGCGASTVDIGVTVTDADDFTVTWVGLDGGTPVPTTGPNVSVSEAGTYEATVVNNETGCETTTTITVTQDSDGPPISFTQPAPFDCTGDAVTIDASATGLPSDFNSISWTGPAGATITPPDALIVQVDAAGEYVLTIEGADGCISMETITVTADDNTPLANAGDDFSADCFMIDNLDGTQSSQGADFSYTWTVISGADLEGDVNSLMPEVTGAGTYELVVINNANGCEATDQVTVDVMLPEAAEAGDNSVSCDGLAQLSGNLPTGTTGTWMSNGAATVSSPDQATTDISGLNDGNNVFTWTLSAPFCPEYSSDQVTVNLATAPELTPDQLLLSNDMPTSTLDLLANDDLNGATNFSVRIIDAPTFGMVDTLTAGGALTFTSPPGLTAQTMQLEYEVCNLDCPDLCATSFIQISFDDDGEAPELPNGITPNGDGMNETLVFDILNFNPADAFPDNEIIIFNRWGDVVYQAKPYTNDWDGTSQSGELLPEATYYYVLRLNLAEGEIYRGSITVIR